MGFKLQKPTIEMEGQYWDFVREWEDSNEEIVPYAARPLGMKYREWLEKTSLYEQRETCPSNFVPSHIYFLVSEDERIIGAINIRHCLNEYLFNIGGHIGYGIRPSERKKGYASLMLSLALPIARSFKIYRALITCDKKNIGSARTIIKNGGVLDNEVKSDGEIIQRYWIELLKED